MIYAILRVSPISVNPGDRSIPRTLCGIWKKLTRYINEGNSAGQNDRNLQFNNDNTLEPMGWQKRLVIVGPDLLVSQITCECSRVEKASFSSPEERLKLGWFWARANGEACLSVNCKPWLAPNRGNRTGSDVGKPLVRCRDLPFNWTQGACTNADLRKQNIVVVDCSKEPTWPTPQTLPIKVDFPNAKPVSINRGFDTSKKSLPDLFGPRSRIRGWSFRTISKWWRLLTDETQVLSAHFQGTARVTLCSNRTIPRGDSGKLWPE